MPRGLMLLLAVLLTGCGASTKGVRLETARGSSAVFIPRGGGAPVTLDARAFAQALPMLARDMRPSSQPLRDARRWLAGASPRDWKTQPARGSLGLISLATGEEVPGGHRLLAPLPADVELMRAYGQWCERKSQPADCLHLLEPDSTLGSDGKYALAMRMALDSVWEETARALKDMADPAAVQTSIVSAMAMYLMLWVLPEPVSKGVAATLTVALMAYLGVDTVWRLIDGWVQLVREVDRATTFDAVRAAGERYGRTLGEDAARIFVMLATAAIGETAAGLAAKLPRLPGSAQAAVQAEARLGVRLAHAASVESVAVSAESVTLSLAPGAMAMAARGFNGQGGSSPSPTRPSGAPNPHARPSGTRATPSPRDDEATRRALLRENESADVLAQAGYDVEQRPSVPGTPRRPDYRIEGRIFDNYAPSTRSPRNIWTVLNDTKVNPAGKPRQADRIVLNLRDSLVELDALRQQFTEWVMPNLQEVLVITREGQVVLLWP